MSPSDYGPFANVVAVACALVATFSALMLKAFGRIARWTWLAAGSPPFLVTAAPRAVALAVMSATYISIDKSNYHFFAALAMLAGILTFLAVVRFDWLRRIHVVTIPLVGGDGRQVGEANVVIGVEKAMQTEARRALAAARKNNGGLSLSDFMSGFGATRVNDPEAIWDREELERIRSKLMLSLMSALLCGVLALFWSALVVEVFSR